jgi:hypothetical protein
MFNHTKDFYVDHISKINSHSYIKDIQENFLNDKWQREECNSCIITEKSNLVSKRQNSLSYDTKHIRRWDIRTGNVCNLKCLMCNTRFSSKWNEDAEILTKKGFNSYKDLNYTLSDSDWDYILSATANKAEEIYLAGGEPFYDKSITKFLKNLSMYDFNRNHTRIIIQTNGVSNNKETIDVLKKFKNCFFNISIDGWGDVNELIRFPTNHQTFYKNVIELKNIAKHINFNLTVQALNFPHVDYALTEINKNFNNHTQLHLLHLPDYLSIDALHPSVIEEVKNKSSNQFIINCCNNYKYNETLNSQLKTFLETLDFKRKTNSKNIVPWCFY